MRVAAITLGILLGATSAAPVLAQAVAAAATTDVSALTSIGNAVKDIGVPIAMLIWFAVRVEARLKAIEIGLAAMTEKMITAQGDDTKRTLEGQTKIVEALTKVAGALENVDDHLSGHTPPLGVPTLVKVGG